jgi:serine/threonine-protein kinase
MKSCPTCSRTYPDDTEFCSQDATHLIAYAIGTETQLAAGLARRFRIIRRLGAGGMGTVFLAEQIGVGNRPVALKVLNRKLLDDPEFLLRFQNEAASTGRIDHPNVVTIYESAQADDGTPYIAMQFLKGETLRDALKRRGALPLAECVEILQQTARGLNAAHRLGIIHRDLKPDNIFLTYPEDESGAPASPPANLVVKIVDFGIAKLRESATHTLTGMVLGTPAYMSSEQASGMKSDELDARSDLYSLGIVTYEMLTGRVPFHSDTPLGYLRKHMMDPPPPLRAVRPDLPVLPEVERVVMKALAKDRDERYASVLDFAREFARATTPPPPVESPKALAPTIRVEPATPPPVPAVTPAEVGASSARPAAKRRFPPAMDSIPQPVSARIVVETSPNAQVYLDDTFKGQAGRKGRLVIDDVKSGDHELRVSLSGKREHEQRVTVAEGQGATITAALADAEPPPLPALVEAPRRALSGPDTSTVWENPKDGLKYVWIPPGAFMMGCSPGDNNCDNDEKPAHQAMITKGFWIGRTPVTAAAYKRFARATGRQLPEAPDFNKGWAHENMPIVNVSWEDAQAYCGWMGGRLPTEAEWEYAARGGSTEARYGPIDEVAWYNTNSGDQTHDVAQKRANGFGLYDTLGNVWEWANDRYDKNYYRKSPAEDPSGPSGGQVCVLRGESWSGYDKDVRVSARNWYDPGHWNYNVGFRCCGEVVNP